MRETLTKVLSACKNSSWNHIPVRRGKKTNSVLQNAFESSFFRVLFLFFLPRLLGMWFHDEFLQALRTFVNVSLKKNWNFLNFFWIFFDFTVHAGAYELGINSSASPLKVLLWCRLFTDVPGLFVYGPLYNAWRIEACLRRCVHDWRLRRGILLPNMGGSMILGLAPLRFRRYMDPSCFLYFAFLSLDVFLVACPRSCMHACVMRK